MKIYLKCIDVIEDINLFNIVLEFFYNRLFSILFHFFSFYLILVLILMFKLICIWNFKLIATLFTYIPHNKLQGFERMCYLTLDHLVKTSR